MIPVPDILDEAHHLATLMVDQIEWVDVLHAPDEQFLRRATQLLRGQHERDALKRIIDNLAKRLGASKLARRLMDPIAVCAAAKLVVSAIKGLMVAMGNRDIHRYRLIVRFSSIEAPWVEDERAPALVV